MNTSEERAKEIAANFAEMGALVPSAERFLRDTIAAALSAARREEREAIVKLGLSYESDDDLLNRYIASIRALPDGGGKP